MTKSSFLFGAAALALAIAGCGDSAKSDAGTTAGTASTSAPAGGDAKIGGAVAIDGSSTVQPISEAMAEEFGKENSGAKVTVAASGTGGGFKKFAAGEIDIAGASRPIEKEEEESCKKNGIDYIEVPIAFDGLSVVLNPRNTWAEDLTVDELKKIWEPTSKVNNWSQVRPGFPNKPIKLYGAGTASGTFDYFTKAIVGTEKSSRADYQASEDDNVLVQGVAGDEGALGYFGFAYYQENQDKLKLAKVNGIAPDATTIADGTYQPLSRPLFYYVNLKSLNDKPAVGAYLKFVLAQAKELIPTTGYVPLPEEAYTLGQARIDGKKTGTLFQGAQTGIKIQDVMKKEGGA
ncbi:PstS family phosphate ABC transporter substrate-binding protein [soil metagenome]